MLPWFTCKHCLSITQEHARELNAHTQEYTASEHKITSELYRILTHIFLLPFKNKSGMYMYISNINQ